MTLTHHAKRRMWQRRIGLLDIKYAVCCGARYQSGQHTVCQIRYRQALRLGNQLRRLLGLTVVMCPKTHVVITAYWDELK